MWDITVSNIAGIQAADATLADGLNVVQASNFMGKSSFMSALQTVMGTTGLYGDSHPLTEGATEGQVTLETADDDYEVRLRRTESGAIAREGTPVLSDETDRTCARLFAFLGENNPIRARVRNGEDITSLLQAPLDIENIDEQIATLRQQRAATERQLEEAEQAASNIPSVTEAITTLESELEELRERRDDLAERAAAESSADTAASDDIADHRSQLQATERTISRLDKQIERTETQLQSKRDELAALDIPDEPSVTADIEEKEAKIETLDLRIDLLEGLHRANQRVLEEDEVELVSSVERGLVADEIGCWVCGASTASDDIEAKLASMADQLDSLREERTALQDEIATIEARKEEIERKRRRETELEDTIGGLRADLDELRSDHQQALDRKERLTDELDALREAAAEAETEVNEELTDVKAEIRTREDELAEQRSRLDALEDQRDAADDLAERKEELDTEIRELRDRKTEKQWELKDQFDTAMTDAIERFAPGFDGARLNVKTDQRNEIEAFELVIARDGRETEIGNLSEGEQELVGILVALAGHRTFDVGERVPVVLLDGISQLSAENLRLLTEYLADTSPILVTTAYPEAGEFGGHRISPDSWRTISDGEPSTA
ncbi:archaea-specific SMC-related protein [Haloarcula onubensis]|uniref:Chromosome segregation protein SMC n=1 Tax=Haloarcula onubensis TaxID=2950539 RepID=A0ABU2FJZ6_9EURY|nr:archaea-specific SMC-related protein [Halomicroarcula sp. S3CR25-11]MDS0280744.1 chromosome segregation protein SMC [Halomicroarcula sp. S3CR25-11]